MLTVDVFHDTVCPWCRIGKKNLKDAIAQYDGEVEVRYHTFFLNNTIPVEGYPFREYMLAKGNHRVPLEQFFDGPRRAGEAAGLTFNFEQITKAPNSTLSHRLIVLTPEEQREAIIDALYAAYFEHGRDIGDVDVLVEIAVENGWEADVARDTLISDAGQHEVMADADFAHQVGISGVPFFIINNTWALSGAQPVEVFLRALQQIGSGEIQPG
ncbi:MAG: DsbA family protein [Anaerolineae bacterium]